MQKIRERRIGGRVGSWLHNFLSNRTLQVSANGALSTAAPVLSGVPQGTVLGPILFLIMISDIDKDLQCSFISLFADDSRVSAPSDTQADSIRFQDELSNVIYPWAQRNKASFNGDKFNTYILERIPTMLPTTMINYRQRNLEENSGQRPRSHHIRRPLLVSSY